MVRGEKMQQPAQIISALGALTEKKISSLSAYDKGEKDPMDSP